MAEVSSKMTWLKRGGRVRPGDGKKEPSLASSMESLTQSQLNLAIMDMLNLGQNWNRCEEVCRGKLYMKIQIHHRHLLKIDLIQKKFIHFITTHVLLDKVHISLGRVIFYFSLR